MKRFLEFWWFWASVIGFLGTLVLLFSGCRPGPVFESDFEGAIVKPPEIVGRQWWQGIEGGGWPPEIPGVTSQGFQYQMSSAEKMPWRFVQNRMVTVEQHDGTIGKVLAQVVHGGTPEQSIGRHRSNYLLNPDSTFTEAYQSSWIYLQPDMEENMAKGNGTWRQLWEMKCAPNPGADQASFIPSFRYFVTMEWRHGHGLFWNIAGEHRPHPGHFGDYEFQFGQYAGEVLPRPPLGRWFQLRIYWKSSAHPDSGRFVVMVDDDVLCNYTGRTRTTQPAHKLNIMKLYVDPRHLEEHGYSAYQFVDDVEIWADAERKL